MAQTKSTRMNMQLNSRRTAKISKPKTSIRNASSVSSKGPVRNGIAPLRKPMNADTKTKPCKGFHKLKKWKGHHRCRLCKKIFPEVYLCRNCDWAGCEKCINLIKSRRRSKGLRPPDAEKKSAGVKLKQVKTEKLSSRASKSVDILRADKKAKKKVKSVKSKQIKTEKLSSRVPKSMILLESDKNTGSNIELTGNRSKTKSTRGKSKTIIRKLKETRKENVPAKKLIAKEKKIMSRNQEPESQGNSTQSTPFSNFEIVSESEEDVTVYSMSSIELCGRLRSSGKDVLRRVADVIQKEELDGEDIIALTQRELSLLLPKLGMRKKLQRFLAELDKKSVERATFLEGCRKNKEAIKKPWFASLAKRRALMLSSSNSLGHASSNGSNLVLQERQPGRVKKMTSTTLKRKLGKHVTPTVKRERKLS